ncbi:hypothetical protein [Lysobacter hankyongensis]|uniref:Alanine acetyltransferase n=1 Tax=Lysobacter hankyongensis TaxID=1176535 RepID=A0ABP9BGC0_9GAMM
MNASGQDASFGAAPLWDAVQRETLAAMGLPVYRMLGAAAPETASAAARPDSASTDDRLPEDRLIAALLRAAGRSRDAHDAAQLVRGWPTPQTLRRDPGAKRALWPALRALRRSPA